MDDIRIALSLAEFLFMREALDEKFDILLEEMNEAEERSRTNKFTLGVEQVLAMKEAGVWNNPEKRMQMMNKLHEDQIQKEKPKKPHWTQTPSGKIIMANRKPRGWKKK
jgi:hypothetical protein